MTAKTDDAIPEKNDRISPGLKDLIDSVIVPALVRRYETEQQDQTADPTRSTKREPEP
jgi:hypothetical protein